MRNSYDYVFIGLSLSSSWGNGHATTYRALLRGLQRQGARVLFLERDRPWFADHRDLPSPDFCDLVLYDDPGAVLRAYRDALQDAEAVVVGSYVPDAVALIDELVALLPRRLCFYDIDTPVTLARLRAGDEEFLARRQVPDFDLYFSFAGGPVLETLEREFGARRARPLYCSVDPGRYRNTGEAFDWDLGYLGTYSEDRQPALEALLLETARRLPDRRFVVAGSQYPPTVDWPDNCERIDHVPPEQHASFYSRQRFTLNVTRAAMVRSGWSPSVRLFEAAACGTPLISDAWPGLEELFADGSAIVVAHRTDDVVAAIAGLGEAERAGLAAEAARIVARDHSGAARARQFTQALRESAIVLSA